MEGFSDILGQRSAVDLLRRAVERGQPFHAYLFHGPESVGKAATAKAFAKALLCLTPGSGGEACGECPSCRKMESGNHPDFRLIGIQRARPGGSRSDGEQSLSAGRAQDKSRISIDQIRQNPTKPRVTPPPLTTDAFYRPIVGKWKVALIDPADLLTDEAGSALLKLLEEPPSYVVIILLTSRPGLVLSTLRSRCWPVRFGLVPRSEVAKALLGIGLQPERARPLSALSEGRIGWAIANAQKEEIETARRATIALLSRLPRMRPQEALQFAEGLREIAIANFSGQAEEEESEGEGSSHKAEGERGLRASLPPVLDLAICWFRDLLLVSQGAEEMVTNEDSRQLLAEQASNLTVEQIRASILAALESKRLLSRFANPILATEALALRLQAKWRGEAVPREASRAAVRSASGTYSK